MTAEATHIDHAPRLDGTLDDQLWQSAKVIADFRQREPKEGEPATEKTEVPILYMRHAVYQNKPLAYAANLELDCRYATAWDDPVLKLP